MVPASAGLSNFNSLTKFVSKDQTMKIFLNPDDETFSGSAEAVIALRAALGQDVVLTSKDGIEVPVNSQSTSLTVIEAWSDQENLRRSLPSFACVFRPDEDLAVVIPASLKLTAKHTHRVLLVHGRNRINVYPWTSAEYLWSQLKD